MKFSLISPWSGTKSNDHPGMDQRNYNMRAHHQAPSAGNLRPLPPTPTRSIFKPAQMPVQAPAQAYISHQDLTYGPRYQELQDACRVPPPVADINKLPTLIINKQAYKTKERALLQLYPALPPKVAQLFLECSLPSPWIKFFVDPGFSLKAYASLTDVEDEDQLFQIVFKDKLQLMSAVNGVLRAMAVLDIERAEVIMRYQESLTRLDRHVDFLSLIRFHLRIFPQLLSPAPEYAYVESLWERKALELIQAASVWRPVEGASCQAPSAPARRPAQMNYGSQHTLVSQVQPQYGNKPTKLYKVASPVYGSRYTKVYDVPGHYGSKHTIVC